MSLLLLMHALEERLLGLEYLKDELVQQFLAPAFIPTYWNGLFVKHNLAKRIEQFLQGKKLKLFEEEGNQFAQIYRIDCESIKRIDCGRKNSEQLPEDLFKRLTTFEAVYFLAGIWRKKTASRTSERFSEKSLQNTPLKIIIPRIIDRGIRGLKYGVERTGALRIPYAGQMLKRCKQAINAEEINVEDVNSQYVSDETFEGEHIEEHMSQLCSLNEYLTNCDKLNVKPLNISMFDLERTHPASWY
ncbi:hypothetical protein COV11_04225 [Candidatus Woesearchaeota archaeon CG10_big_fil_rev_8_21_14_0_10_30_7]|nr:MAG: hypothetical protein COV11_04225 [Candidatus Woesearchaeota archaeon CG10_big_fil_rev_8_21_14_0_10_30_7]